MKKVGIHYFAFLKEDRGLDFEWITTPSLTAGELFLELKKRFNWPYDPALFKAAVNDSFCGFETTLNEGDEVVFIPPVSGGSHV